MFVGKNPEERELAREETGLGLWKQEQKIFGFPWGQCIRSSYASLLNIPMEKVPDFSPGALGGPNRQLRAEKQWLATLGYRLVVIPVIPGKPTPSIPKNFYHLISAYSPTSLKRGHRVVGRGGKVIWDPHVRGPGIGKIRAFYLVLPA